MQKDEYKELIGLLSEKKLLSEEDLDEAYNEIISIKEMDTKNKNNYIIMIQIIEELQKEGLIKEQDVRDFMNRLNDNETNEFHNATMQDLEDYEMKADEKFERNLVNLGLYISGFMTVIWLIIISVNVKSIVGAIILSAFPAYHMKKASELFSINFGA